MSACEADPSSRLQVAIGTSEQPLGATGAIASKQQTAAICGQADLPHVTENFRFGSTRPVRRAAHELPLFALTGRLESTDFVL
jgi:hypothetical protein